MNKRNKEITIHSSAAEGGASERFEIRYEDENIWLTQRMMAELYDVSVPAISQHLHTVFTDGELHEDSVVKKYLITAADGKKYNTMHYNLQATTFEQAKLHAETQYEKYRIVQDRLFQSDFDRFLLNLQSEIE
jgi:hypothetical protein